MPKKKSTVGRKPLPPKEKKVSVSIYRSPQSIAAVGGPDAARKVMADAFDAAATQPLTAPTQRTKSKK